MKSKLYLLVILISTLTFSQDDDDFAKRLKAINNQTIIFIMLMVSIFQVKLSVTNFLKKD